MHTKPNQPPLAQQPGQSAPGQISTLARRLVFLRIERSHVQCLVSSQATTHFESGLGVALKGKVPPGAVTLLR